MIVNKPQFDTDKIKPGQAYWIKDDRGYRSEINCPCIIYNVKPFTIEVSYYSKKEKEMRCLTIDINSIIMKNFILTPMAIEKITIYNSPPENPKEGDLLI